MANKPSVLEIFSEFQDSITAEHAKRESIRTIVYDVEQKSREINTLLQSVHHDNGLSAVEKLCAECHVKFLDVQKQITLLSAEVVDDSYYRYNDLWKFVIQKLCFLAALLVYLETEKLISRETCAELIGAELRREDGFHLDLEDYLIGLLQLASELSRLSVNAVTSGDYSRPIRIASFVCELDSGFRLLNLKNDVLRRRYDALKYDLKKAEEVVYDIKIRGLAPNVAE